MFFVALRYTRPKAPVVESLAAAAAPVGQESLL
jgi:hypothetical protein